MLIFLQASTGALTRPPPLPRQDQAKLESAPLVLKSNATGLTRTAQGDRSFAWGVFLDVTSGLLAGFLDSPHTF